MHGIHSCFTFVDVPSRPSRPEVLIATESSATITWTPPYDDGGDKIKRYAVQYKTTDGTHWATCTEEPTECQITIGSLKPDSEYEFRVTAINSAGRGECSQPSMPFTPEKVVGMYLRRCKTADYLWDVLTRGCFI